MRWFAWAATAAVVFAAPCAHAGEGYCEAMVKGAGSESVEVDFTVKDGAITSRGAKWHAPLADGKDAPQGPTLEIGYWPIASEALTAPTSVTVSVFNQSGVSNTAGATATLAVDGGKSWSVQTFSMLFVTMGELAADTDGSDPLNPELLALVEHAHGASASLTSPAGAQLASAAFDLSSHVARDALFRKAWDAAGQLAAAPDRCSGSPVVSTLAP